jgi:hypothetical protein
MSEYESLGGVKPLPSFYGITREELEGIQQSLAALQQTVVEHSELLLPVGRESVPESPQEPAEGHITLRGHEVARADMRAAHACLRGGNRQLAMRGRAALAEADIDPMADEAVWGYLESRRRRTAQDSPPEPVGYIIAGPNLAGDIEADWDGLVYPTPADAQESLASCRETYTDWTLYGLYEVTPAPQPGSE